MDDLLAQWVTFSYELEQLGERWRYAIIAVDHFVGTDGAETVGPEARYETGPLFDTREAAQQAGEATVSYYHYLYPVEEA